LRRNLALRLRAREIEMSHHEQNVMIAAFNDRSYALSAVDRLHEAGFSDTEIGILSRDDGEDAVKTLQAARRKKTGPGAAVGAAVGLGVGALVAAVPGIGPVLVGGVLASIMAGAVTGAAAGSLVGALVGLGLDEDVASYFERKFRDGETIVLVVTGDRTPAAFRLFHHFQSTSWAAPQRLATGLDQDRIPTQRLRPVGSPDVRPRAERGRSPERDRDRDR
jgi:uncharacterized membrane protein